MVTLKQTTLTVQCILGSQKTLKANFNDVTQSDSLNI